MRLESLMLSAVLLLGAATTSQALGRTKDMNEEQKDEWQQRQEQRTQNIQDPQARAPMHATPRSRGDNPSAAWNSQARDRADRNLTDQAGEKATSPKSTQ